MKGIFIPEITVEMFRNGCLEAIETLMTEGEVYDIEYDPKSAQPERKTGKWRHYEGQYICEECGAELDEISPFCPMCGADMRQMENRNED